MMPSKSQLNYSTSTFSSKYLSGGRKKFAIIFLFVLIVVTVLDIVFHTPRYDANSPISIKKNADFKSNTNSDDNFKKQYLSRLNSAILKTEIAKQLNLTAVFYRKNFLKNSEWFGEDLPVKVELIKNEAIETESFILKDFNETSFELVSNDESKTYRFKQLITRPGVKFKILKTSLSPVPPPDLVLKISGLKKTVDHLDKTIEITAANADSSKINIKVQAASKEKAAVILNSLYQLSLKNYVSDKTGFKALDFIQKQLSDLQRDFSSYKKNISRIKANPKQITAMGSPSSVSVAEARKQLNILKSLTPYTQNATSQFSLFPDNYGIRDDRLNDLINKMNTIQVEKQDILGQEEGTAMLPKLNREIVVLNTDIKARIANQNEEYWQVLNPEKRENKKTENKNIAQQLKELERNHQARLKLYFYLLNKQDEIRSLKTKATIFADRLEKPVITYSSSKFVYVLYAILAVLCLAFLLVFKSETSKEDSFIKAGALKSATLIPVLTPIKFYSHFGRIILPSGADSQTGQQIKEISDLLIRELSNSQKKVMVISSYTKNSGKTFTSTNLANAIALDGKKVVLLDTCIQNNKAQELLSVRPKFGLTDYVNNQKIHSSSIIEKTNLSGNLSFISPGTLDMPTAQLFSNPRMAKLILYLRNKFDCIMIKSDEFEDFFHLNNSKNLISIWINILNENKISVSQLRIFEHFVSSQEAEKRFLLLNQAVTPN